MTRKKLYERFAAVDLLTFLFTKISFLFKPQRYIISILKEAMKRSRMVGVLGREGMGKSSAIAQYMQDVPNVYYIRIGKSYAIKNFFNEMLYQVTGVYPNTSDSLFIQMKMLSSALTEDNTKKLVIVDDAGQLSPRALSVFFELRENTRHTTGFVFVGLDYFLKRLLNAMKLGVPGIAEFHRRIENFYSIPSIPQSEMSDYAKSQGLSDDQVLETLAAKPETIAQLENLVNAILEEAKEAVKEERATKKTSVPGKTWGGKDRPAQKRAQESDLAEEDDDDEIEEALAQKKKESAQRARQAKKSKTKKLVTSDVASS
jgi:hypothetical protein